MQKLGVDYHNLVKTSNKQARGNSSDFCKVYVTTGNNIDLSKTRAAKSTGTSIEIISLCKEVKFGKKQIANVFLLYSSLFIPRLIYNCEAWSNVTDKEISFFRMHS